MDKRSTQPLKDALAVFDAGEAARRAAWDVVETGEQIAACEEADAAALRQVQLVFAELTSDRNRFALAVTAPLKFMRQIAALNEI